MPEATATYQPIGHHELAMFIRNTAKELLRAEPVRESYAVTKDGNRMFGLQVFGQDSVICPDCTGSGYTNNPDSREVCFRCNGTGWAPGDEYGFGIAFRGSYDKSMSIGIAAGHSVFICDNLAISGEIRVIRKHTKGAWDDLDKVLVHTLFRKAPELRERFAEDVNFFKSRELAQFDGYRMLGLLMGRQIVGATQAQVALREWDLITNKDGLESVDGLPHKLPNAWQFYNSVTQALKSSPPHRVLERHKALHDTVKLELQ
jgi:hypothetical protein